MGSKSSNMIHYTQITSYIIAIACHRTQGDINGKVNLFPFLDQLLYCKNAVCTRAAFPKATLFFL
jgi:hypothetical protein